MRERDIHDMVHSEHHSMMIHWTVKTQFDRVLARFRMATPPTHYKQHYCLAGKAAGLPQHCMAGMSTRRCYDQKACKAEQTSLLDADATQTKDCTLRERENVHSASLAYSTASFVTLVSSLETA